MVIRSQMLRAARGIQVRRGLRVAMVAQALPRGHVLPRARFCLGRFSWSMEVRPFILIGIVPSLNMHNRSRCAGVRGAART